MRFLAVAVLLVGCRVDGPGVARMEPERFDSGVFCWEGGVSGLARAIEGDVQAVLTSNRPEAYRLSEVALVSGGVLVDETVSEEEAVLRVTPDNAATPVVVSLVLACRDFGSETPATVSIVPSSLTSDWSAVTPSYE